MEIKSSLACCAIIVFIASCGARDVNITRPFRLVPQVPEGGSNEYRQGWKDGCETGALEKGNNNVRVFRNVKVKPEMMQNADYRTAWDISSFYCAQYVRHQLSMGAFDREMGEGIFGNNGPAHPLNQQAVDGMWVDSDNSLMNLPIFQGIPWSLW